MSESHRLQAVVLDWAGTTVDYGSRAPAIVFLEIFRRRGVAISELQAREPMGRAKRDHIAAIAAMPAVAEAWEAKFGNPVTDDDVDAMYADFLPLQKRTLEDHSEVIPGVADAIAACRAEGLKIGSSTGYTCELMEVVRPIARQQGYDPDCVVCGDETPRGRPSPFPLFENAMRLDVYPMSTILKVDDTPVGIEAGRNAGCWTIGVTLSGNCVGRSVEEVAALSSDDRTSLVAAADERLRRAGAHHTIASVADLPAVIRDVNERMSRGERPD